MEITTINPAELARLPGSAHAMLVQGGKTLHLAGQEPLDKDGNCVAPGDVVKQFEQILANLKVCCNEVGAEMTDIVVMRIYVTDRQLYKAHGRELAPIYRQYFGKHFPAMTLVQVAALWNDDNLVEIEALAALPE